MAIKLFRGNKKAITALKLIPLVLIIYTCEERTFNNPFDTGVELNPDDWAPTNLTIEILSDSDARLAWQNSKTNITLYKIERKISTGSSFVEVGSSDTTIYTDTGLKTGNEYIYQVCAYAGDQKSSYISSDTIMTVFPVPYNFSSESLRSGIVLTWEDSTSFEESFQVERKAISSNAYTILDSTQANTYLDSLITLGNQYIYRVSAFSNYNSTSYTETAVVKYWQDCLDVWGGDAKEDNCGICDNDSSNDCNVDCAGVENGNAVEDCSGECGGTAVEDECGVCNGNGTTCSAPVTDIDGNVYETVQIGDQVWMAENLKVAKYKDGSAIYTGYTDSEWADLEITETGAYGVYDDDPANADIYGYLYNWYAVDDNRGLCMDGWHVPTDYEYKQLEMYLGMSEEDTNILGGTGYLQVDRGTNEGSKLAGRSDLWNSSSQVFEPELVNNIEFGTSGFNALPGGQRVWNGNGYNSISYSTAFWSTSVDEESDGEYAWHRHLDYRYSEVGRSYHQKTNGNYIRCIKGEMPDCNGIPGGSATEDNCGTCDSDSSNDCVQDCNDEWGGSAVEDECGVCGGDGTSCSTTVTDIDGNVYQTVQIGEQVWMAENLKTTKYKDGSAIPTGYSGSDWGELETGAYAVYDNSDPESATWGRLYNWYAVDDSRSICPEGWHVPSDNEYTILTDYLGGESVAGGKMKETGLEHWYSANTGATNESGFTGLPAGYRGYDNGYYTSMGYDGCFWSSSEGNSGNAWYRVLNCYSSNVYRGSYSKQYGFSIRCLGD